MNKYKMNKILFCFLISLFYLLTYMGLGKILINTIGKGNNEYLLYLIVYFIMSILLLLTMYFTNRANKLLFDKATFFKGLKIGGFILTLSIIVLIGKINTGIKSDNELLPISNIIYVL